MLLFYFLFYFFGDLYCDHCAFSKQPPHHHLYKYMVCSTNYIQPTMLSLKQETCKGSLIKLILISWLDYHAKSALVGCYWLPRPSSVLNQSNKRLLPRITMGQSSHIISILWIIFRLFSLVYACPFYLQFIISKFVLCTMLKWFTLHFKIAKSGVLNFQAQDSGSSLQTAGEQQSLPAHHKCLVSESRTKRYNFAQRVKIFPRNQYFPWRVMSLFLLRTQNLMLTL